MENIWHSKEIELMKKEQSLREKELDLMQKEIVFLKMQISVQDFLTLLNGQFKENYDGND